RSPPSTAGANTARTRRSWTTARPRTRSTVTRCANCTRRSRTRSTRTEFSRPAATASGRSTYARHEEQPMSDARDIIEQLLKRSRGPRGPNGPRTIPSAPPGLSWRTVLIALAALLVFLAVWTSWYTVQPEERAVIKRFGRVIGTADPGPHLKLPAPIDSV